jgi:hypothetical protein
MPDWYPNLRAAKYLGVPPWELDKDPEKRMWTEWALAAEAAEAHAKQPKTKWGA